MKDPTRIPRVLDAVRTAWEGQPDIELATLFAMLANQGWGWGTDDAELLAQLEAMARRHPPEITAATEGLVMMRTESPEARVSLDVAAQRVTVRRRPDVQPVSWLYGEIGKAHVGEPLRLTDAAGARHRLGVVASVTVEASRRPRASLTGLTRGALDGDVYALRCREGKQEWLVLVGAGMDVYSKGLRQVSREHVKWARLETAECGQPLRVARKGGGSLRLGEVCELFAVELGSRD